MLNGFSFFGVLHELYMPFFTTIHVEHFTFVGVMLFQGFLHLRDISVKPLLYTLLTEKCPSP